LQATAYPISATVTALISDTHALIVVFNLGTTALNSTDISSKLKQPGIGLSPTTFLIKGGGIYTLTDYASGYLTTTLATTGPFTLTISAVKVSVSASPDRISVGHTTASTITAVVQDHLNNPAPDGTLIRFSTTEGAFPNSQSTYTTTLTGGQVTATLTLGPTARGAKITTQVESVTGFAEITSFTIYLPLVIRND
jgi:hypothetical protein